MAPANWTLILGCNATQQSNSSGSGLAIGVDSTKSHSAPNSVKVNGGDSCGYYFATTAPFASIGEQVYVRFWAQFSGPPTTGHNGFMSMYTGSTPFSVANFANNGDQLRLGMQGGAIVWNDKMTDSTLPDIDTQGEMASITTTPNSWDCIEFHVDQTAGTIEFWFNGGTSTVSGLSWSGTAMSGVSDNWSTGGPKSYALQTFGLGWLQLNNSYTAWYDDVAISSSGRIGCGN